MYDSKYFNCNLIPFSLVTVSGSGAFTLVEKSAAFVLMKMVPKHYSNMTQMVCSIATICVEARWCCCDFSLFMARMNYVSTVEG